MEASGCKFAFFTKIDEPGANLFGPECFGRAAKVCGETGNLQQIRALCVVCEVADDHVMGCTPLRVVTGIARSARRAPHTGGSRHVRPTCCPWSITTWSSRCPPRSARSPGTTRQ